MQRRLNVRDSAENVQNYRIVDGQANFEVIGDLSGELRGALEKALSAEGFVCAMNDDVDDLSGLMHYERVSYTMAGTPLVRLYDPELLNADQNILREMLLQSIDKISREHPDAMIIIGTDDIAFVDALLRFKQDEPNLSADLPFLFRLNLELKTRRRLKSYEKLDARSTSYLDRAIPEYFRLALMVDRDFYRGDDIEVQAMELLHEVNELPHPQKGEVSPTDARCLEIKINTLVESLSNLSNTLKARVGVREGLDKQEARIKEKVVLADLNDKVTAVLRVLIQKLAGLFSSQTVDFARAVVINNSDKVLDEVLFDEREEIPKHEDVLELVAACLRSAGMASGLENMSYLLADDDLFGLWSEQWQILIAEQDVCDVAPDLSHDFFGNVNRHVKQGVFKTMRTLDEDQAVRFFELIKLTITYVIGQYLDFFSRRFDVDKISFARSRSSENVDLRPSIKLIEDSSESVCGDVELASDLTEKQPVKLRLIVNDAEADVQADQPIAEQDAENFEDDDFGIQIIQLNEDEKRLMDAEFPYSRVLTPSLSDGRIVYDEVDNRVFAVIDPQQFKRQFAYLYREFAGVVRSRRYVSNV